eukprot:TRINITY_DN194_c0_g6_i2.p1 TRINITY_DN194_c0_g6~~TRINITY_DN194_c0_g6_i2.p1  ORF type:complete len:174 (+),score=35.78 TRINITY_DN194_c0_g6_i2:69-590(+)
MINPSALGPELEQQCILRVPKHIADILRKILSGDKSKSSNFSLTFDDERHCKLQLDETVMKGVVVDLPCVVESLKTLDRSLYYKSGDIGQMIIINDKTDIEEQPEEERIFDDEYHLKFGITPPTGRSYIRSKKRAKKRAKLGEIEEQFLRLLRSENESILADSFTLSSHDLFF